MINIIASFSEIVATNILGIGTYTLVHTGQNSRGDLIELNNLLDK